MRPDSLNPEPTRHPQETDDLALGLESHRPASRRTWRRRMFPFAGSALVHGLLIVAALLLAVDTFVGPLRLSGSGTIDTQLPSANLAPDPQPEAPVHVAPAELSVTDDPAPDNAVDSGSLTQFIHSTFDAVRTEASQQDETETFVRLESMAAKLQTVASENSLDQTLSKVSNAFGLSGRAVQPVDTVEAQPFDQPSAQFHDVVRRVENDGAVAYVGVLIDRNGTTVEIDLEPEDGARLARIFELMKQFPLLERVYRQATMAILDQMVSRATVAAGKTGTADEASSPELPAEAPATDRESRPRLP